MKSQVNARKVTWRGYVASSGDFTGSVTSPLSGRSTLQLPLLLQTASHLIYLDRLLCIPAEALP